MNNASDPNSPFARKAMPLILGVSLSVALLLAVIGGWQAYLVHQYDQQIANLQNDYEVVAHRNSSDLHYAIFYDRDSVVHLIKPGVEPPPKKPQLDDLTKLQPPAGLAPALVEPMSIIDLPIELVDQQTTVLPHITYLWIAGPIRGAEDLEAIFHVFPNLDLLLVDNLRWDDATQAVLGQQHRKLKLNVPIEDAPDSVDETKTVTTGDITQEVKTSRIGLVEVNWFSRAPILPPQPSTEIGETEEEDR